MLISDTQSRTEPRSFGRENSETREDAHFLLYDSVAVIDDNNRRANLRRRFKDYTNGDQVLLFTIDRATLQERAIGPFPVVDVHVNGTITIQREQNVVERVNIRRVRPYNARPP